jgi:hypothetical protein
MDPYLEDPAVWPEFHQRLVAALRKSLLASLAGSPYGVVTQTRRSGTLAEDYLEIQRPATGLVTLVDVVSPANKTTDAGREAYLGVRQQARDGGASVVEIDLVLQGRPTLDYSRENLPDWDYAVTVTRATHPERHEIYTATLQKQLPRFRVPLASDDRDTVLDLREAFAQCYAEGGYLGRIDYCREPAVPLEGEDYRWLDATLQAHGLRGPTPPAEEVAVGAYYLWEQEGRPHGQDREHWDRALAQLRREKLT